MKKNDLKDHPVILTKNEVIKHSIITTFIIVIPIIVALIS